MRPVLKQMVWFKVRVSEGVKSVRREMKRTKKRKEELRLRISEDEE